jgi:hypothetical protein
MNRPLAFCGMFSLAYDRNGKHARALWHKLKGQEYSRIEKETYSKLPLLEWKRIAGLA